MVGRLRALSRQAAKPTMAFEGAVLGASIATDAIAVVALFIAFNLTVPAHVG